MTTTEERLSRLEGGYEHVATKADIADVRAEIASVRGELKADIAEVRREIAATRGELKADIADLRGDLRAEMHRLHAGTLRWLYGLLGTIVLTAIAAILVNIFV